MTEQVEQWICIKFCVKLEHSSAKLFGYSEGRSYMQLVIGSFITTTCPLMHHVSCRVFWQNINSPRWLGPYSPDLAPCDFWLFPKLKSPLKGKRFQTINEIQENTTGQLMAIGRTVWGPKVPTLKGPEVSLSYVQCLLYLVSSSINVSIFHSTWLDTFWTDLIYIYKENKSIKTWRGKYTPLGFQSFLQGRREWVADLHLYL